ncbi:acyltransferase family protein [uncultured Microbacterium sp.]|uniref:Acyltransferase domain-containing membrane protein n=1 Tax=uncultured Microbacterium sp. TaxID=191216 RepID=A0A1Y5NXB8_9MICO|nr:acyltransferase family protein [uncultured Microbacterium sp.]SBS71024.1 Acyltransferase domain-containing membrane protein [uncultured Microbacterium sp.]
MTRAFFPEVQALRALAVGLVVVFHLQPALLRGGFIGVDVFFVISGYLITGHLLREQERTGTVRLRDFWAARARRILPAAITCLVVTVALCAALLPITRWGEVGVHALAAALSVLNWVLGAEAVDYFAGTDMSPFQHFWSLGVEEQFYLAWPLLVVLAWFIAARRPGRAPRRVLAVLFATAVAASFAYSVWSVSAGDAAAYFSTLARVWELGAGGLLAIVAPKLRLPAAGRTALSLGGIAVVLAGAFVIDRGDPFPGLLALVPVLGTVAVIAAGPTTGRFAPAPVFALRPVQWIGDISYSLYLWHFPPIVLFAAVVGRAPGPFASLALAACALLAAALSHRFIEQPARSNAWLRARSHRGLMFGVAATTVGCLVALSLPVSQQSAEASWLDAAQQIEATGPLGAAALVDGRSEAFVDGVMEITPAPTEAEEDMPASPRACMAEPKDARTPVCTAGDPEGEISVALVGDSHAHQLSTVLFALAGERSWDMTTYLHASCPFTTETRALEARGGSVCAAPNAETLAALLADPPDIVFVSNWASGDFVEADTGHAPGVAGYADVWGRLVDAGSEVYAFVDVPRPRRDPTAVDCVAASYERPRSCGVSRDEALFDRGVVDKAAALVPGVHVVDLTDHFCEVDFCPAVIGNVLVYRDVNHLTDTYARTLIPYVSAAIPPTAGR